MAIAPLISVSRFQFDKDWTLGRLSELGQQTGYTVEDEVRNVKVHGETAIPTGTYKLGLRFSPKFSHKFYWHEKNKVLLYYRDYNQLTKAEKIEYVPHQLIEIQSVPNFKYVLIHWGNTDLDTEGCLIVGDKIGYVDGRNGVVNSRNYYAKLYSRIYPILNSVTGSLNSYISIQNDAK